MTDNELGYKVYRWDQLGYHFIPNPYNPHHDYSNYLHYYADPEENKKLQERLMNEHI